jgi:hypothetical protein
LRNRNLNIPDLIESPNQNNKPQIFLFEFNSS